MITHTKKRLTGIITLTCICLTIFVPATLVAADKGPVIEIVKSVRVADIVVAKGEHKGLMAAAKDLQRDITKISGVTPNIVHALNQTGGYCIVLGSADCPEGAALLASVGVKVDDIKGKWRSSRSVC